MAGEERKIEADHRFRGVACRQITGQGKTLALFSKCNGKSWTALGREATRFTLHYKGSPGLLLGKSA